MVTLTGDLEGGSEGPEWPTLLERKDAGLCSLSENTYRRGRNIC